MKSSSKSAGRGKDPSQATRLELWARSGGVCQYPGCAVVLYRESTVYWEPVNLGQLAHNVAASPNGPRGDVARSLDLSDDPENLLLLCGLHHKAADSLPSEYRESTLRLWKERHEAQVLSAAQLTHGKIAHPLIVQATQIGGHTVNINETSVIRSLIEEGLAPAARPYIITINTHAQSDGDESYWVGQISSLRDEIRLCRIQMSRDRTDAPIALFALAEMPVLMALGHSLGDKSPIQIHQYTRHSGSWSFQVPDEVSPDFSYTLPDMIDDNGVALIVDLTADIETERLNSVLDVKKIPIGRFTTVAKSTELVRSSNTVQSFRQRFRQCLTDIENRAPRNAPIHIFPCMPASLAVALGCCIMPKVSNPILIYDAKGVGGVFRYCLSLPAALNHLNSPIKSAVRQGGLTDDY